MRLTSAVTLSAALLLSSTAMAQDKKLASNEQVATRVSSCRRRLFRRQPRDLQAPATSGTRMAERVCLTKQQWKKSRLKPIGAHRRPGR
jgi:hypothetical protein